MAQSAQKYHLNVVHKLSAAIAYTDNGSAVTLGVVPASSVVLHGGVVVTEAFNAGTANVLDIGTSADADGFATDLALGTVGVISADEMATTNDAYCSADTTITATPALSGTAATAGAGYVWVEYVVLDN